MKKAIIDGDMLLYKACFAAEEETRWEDDIWTLHADVNRAKVDFDENIVRIMSEIDGSEATIAFSDSDNFRFDVFSQYKANRKKNRKPLGIRDVREWVMQNYPYLVMPRLEADDVCGIICTASPGAYIAVSGDKDFNTIPGTWYNHLTKELKTVTEEEADRFFLRQVLTGDAVDGYNGIHGVGPKTADRMLTDGGATWETVVEAYKKKGYDETDALVTARLARILRHCDYDYETNEIKLWEP
tara:strand:- start:14136 stop:14861 length:726 start_codon:yes stop_codon:yes gene_type:complete